MAKTAKLYDIALAKIVNGDMYWDASGDTFKLVLMTNDYEFDSAHETYADLTNEISDTGNYTAGGLEIDTLAPTYDSGILYFGANDTTLTGATCTFRKLAIYDDTVDNNLLLYIDLGADQTLTAEGFTFFWNTDAIWYGLKGGGTP